MNFFSDEKNQKQTREQIVDQITKITCKAKSDAFDSIKMFLKEDVSPETKLELINSVVVLTSYAMENMIKGIEND